MQISIKYVNQPSAQSSGKWGSIVDHNGTKIMIPVDRLDEFRAGTTVEVATKEQTWFRNTPDEAVVQVATGGPEGSTRPVQRQGVQSSYQRPVQGQPSGRPNTGFQPRVIQGGPVGGVPPGTDQARQIFVTGVVGRAMGSGKFTASEIRVLTQEAAAAYDAISKPAPTHQPIDPPPGIEPGDPGPELQ